MLKVFVYGTLLGDDTGHNYWHHENVTVTSSRHATVRAKMFLDNYPYIVLDKTGTVRGKVFEVDDATIKEYDMIEGIGTGWYDRKRTAARYDDGTEEEVWVYCSAAPRGGKPMPSGQWKDWYDQGMFLIPQGMGEEPRAKGAKK